MSKELVVEDFMFSSLEEANVAKLEKEKIEKLNEKLKNADNDILFKVYNKSIEKNTFRTPVGLGFMKDIKKKLEGDPNYSSNVLPIPVAVTSDKAKEEEKTSDLKMYREQSKKNSNLFKWSLFINAVLIIIIIALFVISATSKNPNIINYENALIDKYSSWEQELTERENAVKAKESALNND